MTTLAAAGSSTRGSASAGLVFRRDDAPSPSFPVGGAALLVALLAVALWVWWTGRRRAGTAAGPRPPGRLSGLRGLLARPPTTLRIVESGRLDAGTRLHVVEWRSRRYLLATGASGTPLLVDRDGGPVGGTEG